MEKKLNSNLLKNIIKLKDERFVSGTSNELLNINLLNIKDWNEFKNFWNNLEADNHMNDGGSYRYRRFGKFKWFSDGNKLEQQPHGPYYQPLYFNPLNGGVKRYFAPVTENMAQNQVFKTLLLELANHYSEIEDIQTWKINTYFNRIIARPNMKGLPVPEGKHRDGVKFSCLFMADKVNVTGGATTLTDIMHQEPIFNATLEQSNQMLIFRDDTVFHDTTPIEIINGCSHGYRDLLVIEFH